MHNTDWIPKLTLPIIALFLGMIALRPSFKPVQVVSADSGQFDFVHIVSPTFLYKGNQGVLLLDKRNGNVWFIAKSEDINLSYKDPVFVVRIPLEKLDAGPR
jgi:hypothetical protein